MIAAWNVSDRDNVAGSFSPSEIPGTKGNRFIVYDYFAKTATETGLNDEIPVSINRMGYKFYSVIPLINDKAVIGDINKIIPMAAVSVINISEKMIQLTVKEQGTICVYSKLKPVVLRINSKNINEINYNNNVLKVRVDKNNSGMDIEF